MEINLENLDSPLKKPLTKAEKEYINSYLGEFHKTYYREKPVSIKQFISDPRYLGASTGNGKMIYKIWDHHLIEMFRKDDKFLVVLTGSIGTGKTFTSYLGTAYVMYRVMCLKDPWSQFQLSPSGKMNVTFFNLTKSLSESRGFQMLQTLLLRSPWFLENGGIIKGRLAQEVDLPLFSYTLASPYARGFGNVGEHVICAVMDEVDSPIESEKQKIRIIKAYEATVRRFESRFVIKGHTMAKFFLVSSKQDEMSFIETFVEKEKEYGRIYVADVALYDAKPSHNYSGVKFQVKVGDQYNTPEIINRPEEVDKARKEGFEIIDIPVEYKDYFERDIVGALRDIAGRSVGGIRKSKLFPSERFLNECYDAAKEDPVRYPTIEVGLEDDVHFVSYLDFTKMRKHKSEQRYIHCDIAFTTDALGLACSYINGWVMTNVEKEDGTVIQQKAPIIETEWVMRIKARSHDKIPIHKVRKMILDLNQIGFNIAKFTIDLRLASEDTIQILSKAGINADYLSVDKDIKPYMNFRNLVFEKRWVCHKHEFLHFELKHLEYDRNTQKIDHPNMVKDIEFLNDGSLKDVVLKGSKDLADAVAGSVMSALLMGGEAIDTEDAVRIMKKFTDEPEQQKDPFWFMNVGRDKDKKVLGTTADIDTKKQIEIMRKFSQ